MPLTVLASSGVSYHLWQLTTYSSPEIEDSITFDVIDNTLTDGYRAGIRCGFTSGTRQWKLTFPTLASGDIPVPTVTDVNGATVSREQYVRSLFADNKVTSTPFVYQDPQNSTYYFVDFEDKSLSMQRMRIKLYSTGVTLRQVRLAGVTLP